MQLYLAWSQECGEMERAYLMHQMADCYLQSQRASNAQTMWSTIEPAPG